MNNERYWFLMNNDNENLTQDEISQGWHFCMCWDGLLIGPGMEEVEHCYCFEETK
jgi:hypothetical protein